MSEFLLEIYIKIITYNDYVINYHFRTNRTVSLFFYLFFFKKNQSKSPRHCQGLKHLAFSESQFSKKNSHPERKTAFLIFFPSYF